MSPLENINCVGWESIQVYWKKKKTKKVTKKTKKKGKKEQDKEKWTRQWKYFYRT